MSPEKSSASGHTTWSTFAWGDGLCLFVIGLILCTLCIVRSRTRLLWSDEILSRLTLGAPDLRSSLQGWYYGADGGGVLYYLLGHLWLWLFGASRLTLRLFSTAGFFTAIVLIWTIARRFYPLVVVACCVGMVFFLPSSTVWQEFNGRFYGLFLASAAFASVMFLRTWGRIEVSRRDLLLTGCAQACLIGSHVLGLVYSASMLAVLLGTDCYRRHLRWYLEFAVLSGWLVVPISLHAIRATSGVAKGVFWTTRPHLRDLGLGLFGYSNGLLRIAGLLWAAALLQTWLARKREPRIDRSEIGPGAHAPVYALICSILLGQVLLFVKSRSDISIYADRYLLPLAIAATFLLAEGMTFAFGGRAIAYLQRTGATLVVSLLFLLFLSVHAFRSDPHSDLYPTPGFPTRMERMLPPDHDVVVLQIPQFLTMRLYDPTHRYIFLTDWQYLNTLQGADLSGERLVGNVARAGYAPGGVMDCPEFTQSVHQFTILVDPSHLDWFKQRLLAGEGFAAKQMGENSEWWPMSIWSVRQLQPNASCGIRQANYHSRATPLYRTSAWGLARAEAPGDSRDDADVNTSLSFALFSTRRRQR